MPQARGKKYKEAAKAIEKLDLLGVADPHPTTWAALSERKNGTYLLPAATSYETNGSRVASNRSMQWGEQGLVPKVREVPADTIVVAGGFSGKTQIEQAGAGRGALHVAQVLKLAREHGPDGHHAKFPERAYNRLRPNPGTRRRARLLATAGASLAALAAVATAVWRRRR